MSRTRKLLILLITLTFALGTQVAFSPDAFADGGQENGGGQDPPDNPSSGGRLAGPIPALELVTKITPTLARIAALL